MIAQVGDRLVQHGVHLGERTRVGIITAVRHPDGSPPYEVRWLDDGHQTLVFPGPEAHIEPGDRAGDTEATGTGADGNQVAGDRPAGSGGGAAPPS